MKSISLPLQSLASASDIECSAMLGNRSILVVDDCPVSRLVVSVSLRRYGAQVEEAIDGKQALALALSSRFDLLLMDVQMPTLDGLEATSAIRAAGVSDLCIVALSAGGGVKERVDCLNAGMNAVLPKPFSPTMLCAYLAGRNDQTTLTVVPDKDAPTLPGLPELKEIYGGDEAFALRLLGIVAKELPKAAAQIQAAMAAQDSDCIARIAHRLRPCIYGLRQHELHDLLTRIEVLAVPAGISPDLEEAAYYLLAGVDLLLAAIRKRLPA